MKARILSAYPILFFLIALAFVLQGCGNLLGNLRKDLDDDPTINEPTVGGVWPEGGLLDNPYEASGASVGHTDNQYYEREAAGWVSDEQMNANARDQYRTASTSYTREPNRPPQVQRQYAATRVTSEDFVDKAQSTGSLWASDGQTNYFFTKNRIRDVGDLINLEMEDAMVRDISAELKKTLSPNEREVELFTAQEKIKAESLGDKKKAKKKEDEEDEDEQEIREATYADIDVTEQMGVKTGDQMILEIVKRFPNGHYKVRGTKRVPYRGTQRTLAMIAVARDQDLKDNDAIKSGKLYEYRLKVYR